MSESSCRPTDVDALQDIVRSAAGGLRIVAGGTKTNLGRAVDADLTVDTAGLCGVVTYEPEELIIIVRPGTPLAEVEEMLAAEGQHLAFEPPHWGSRATLGGTVACGLSGPRRFQAGGLRDFVLGAEIVDGLGERVRAGGRVVKNVTGYDLPRVLCGSFGTLGILTEICLKLWPRPEHAETLIVYDQGTPAALAALLAWSRLPYEITGLAYQPANGHRRDRALLRLEGAEVAVAKQAASLRESIGRRADGTVQIEIVSGDASDAIWSNVRERPLPGGTDGQVWRYALPPASAPELIEALSDHGLEHFLVDWAGGLVWAQLSPAAPAASLHSLAVRCGGSAWRLAHDADDANPDAFTPMATVLARLNRNLKTCMDPQGRLNPGRMFPPRD